MIDWPFTDRVRVWASRGFPLREALCALIGHKRNITINARGVDEWECPRCDYRIVFDPPEDA